MQVSSLTKGVRDAGRATSWQAGEESEASATWGDHMLSGKVGVCLLLEQEIGIRNLAHTDSLALYTQINRVAMKM